MARVDTNWVLDYVELALIVLLGVGLATLFVHYRRRVSVERRRADRAEAERAELRAGQAELKSVLNAVVTELRDGEGQQQHLPGLRLVKKVVGPVAVLLSGMWAATKSHWYTVATTGAVVVASVGYVGYAVFDVPPVGQNTPPAAAAPRPPTTSAAPRQHAPPAPSETVTPPTTTDTPTTTPTATATVSPTTTPAATTSKIPRSATATTPPTATDTPVAAPSAPTPQVAVTPAVPVDEAAKVKDGKSHGKPPDVAPPTAPAAAPDAPAAPDPAPAEKAKGHLIRHVLGLILSPVLDAVTGGVL